LSEANRHCLPVGELDSNTERFLKQLGAQERSLFAFLFALTANWRDDEDVMPRVGTRLWQQQCDQYDTAKSFDTWARAIVYYLVMAYRKDKSRQLELFIKAIVEAVSNQLDAQQDHADERRDALLRCLRKLDARQRELATVDCSTSTARNCGDAAVARSRRRAELVGNSSCLCEMRGRQARRQLC
jgi:DNA-directed RNA polymerase specialized sigma24 family protein